MAAGGLCLRDSYQFVVSPLGEAEQKALAAAFAAARRTANSWRGVDLQLTHAGAASLPDAKRFASLKPLVRRGIPFEMRPLQWHLMSGAAARQALAGPGAYAALLSRAAAALPKSTRLAVDEDLRPGLFAFATHPTFKPAAGRAALRNVLHAHLVHNPAGYFRGLAHVAGFLLLVLGGPDAEEATFWVLGALMDRLYGHCGGAASYGLKVEACVCDGLVAKKLPKVAAHLSRLGCRPSDITSAWLANCFTTSLPAEVAARVFDALLLEGGKVLHRVALALLRTYEASVLASSHTAQLVKVLDARSRRLFEPDALLGCAFRGIGPLPSAAIDSLRRAAAAAVDRAAAEQRARLDLLLTQPPGRTRIRESG